MFQKREKITYLLIGFPPIPNSLFPITINGLSNFNKFFCLRGGNFFVDSRKSFALQLADIAAYYTRKFVEYNEGYKVSEYHKQTFEKIEKIRINAKIQPFDDILEWVKMNHTN